MACLLLLSLAALHATSSEEIESERKARETGQCFEQLRGFSLSCWSTKAEPGSPVRIVLSGKEKQ